MKTIIFIGSNKSGSSVDALKASAEMHYYTVLLTNQETFIDKRAEFPDVHLIKLCDINKLDKTREAIRSLLEDGLQLHAIVSFIDPHCYTASILSEEFGLKTFSASAISMMQDKIKTREAFVGTQYAPFFYEINHHDAPSEESLKEKLPFILKLPNSAGSKDVHLVQTTPQYKKIVHEIREHSDTPILVEEYLDGPQYLVETVTSNQNVNIIAIIEQEITFTGRFIITGYKMILDRKDQFVQSLEDAVRFIINQFGMKDGPCHLEMRYVKNEWKLIEANPRISGGAMNLFIETAYGLNLVKETLKLALGLEPDFKVQFQKETFMQYVIVPQKGKLIKITGKNKALNCTGTQHVHLRPKKGSIIIPPISMAFRYAYVIATGRSAYEAMKNAKYGASQIKFHMREIDHDTFSQLSNSVKRLFNIADENKKNMDVISETFNNYVLYGHDDTKTETQEPSSIIASAKEWPDDKTPPDDECSNNKNHQTVRIQSNITLAVNVCFNLHFAVTAAGPSWRRTA